MEITKVDLPAQYKGLHIRITAACWFGVWAMIPGRILCVVSGIFGYEALLMLYPGIIAAALGFYYAKSFIGAPCSKFANLGFRISALTFLIGTTPFLFNPPLYVLVVVFGLIWMGWIFLPLGIIAGLIFGFFLEPKPYLDDYKNRNKNNLHI